MKPIPTKPVWYLVGRTGDGHVKTLERYWTSSEAIAAHSQKSSENNGLDYSIDESESIIPDRTLPSEAQRFEIGDFLHSAFVVIRSISYGRSNFEAVEKLSDILHNFPTEMFDPEKWDWNSYIYALRNFEEEFIDLQTFGLAAMLETIKDKEAQQAAPRNR